MKVLIDSLAVDLRDFVFDSDNYIIDAEGFVFDPYYDEYPSEEDIREEMEYQRDEYPGKGQSL